MPFRFSIGRSGNYTWMPTRNFAESSRPELPFDITVDKHELIGWNDKHQLSSVVPLHIYL